MKWGFELEFAAPGVARKQLNETLPSGFYCGIDHSANHGNNHGLELRTNKIFRQGLPRKKFAQSIDLIRSNNGYIHKMCGFHVHFSGFGEMDMRKILEFFNSLRSSNWRSRRSYCGYDLGSRYAPVRLVEGDHYEIRVFNASLSLRAICHHYALTRRAIKIGRI